MKPHHPGRPRRRGLVGGALGLVVLVAAAGCTGLVRSGGVYASKAASDAGDVQATFDAIQPPDRRADTLRGQLDGLLTPAVSVLDELRGAARWGDTAALPRLAAPLPKLAEELQRFQEAHQ